MENYGKIHVVHILYSFDTGGMEKGIATVIRGSVPKFKHTIVCLTRSGKSVKLLPRDIRIIEMHKKEGNSLFFIFRLAKIIKDINPDVVHTRNWGGFDGILAAKYAGVRYIFHGEHGWGMEDPFGLNKKRVILRRIFDHFIYKYTCVSKQIENWLLNDIKVKKQIIQIYSGIDCNLYFPGKNFELRSELCIGNDVLVFGVVARLDPIKNHKRLITVFNKINKKFPKTCLLIVGDGPEETILKSLSSCGVLFLGNRSDVPGLLRCMDVFVLPSFNEGVSNTILEAMASGLPVAASDRGGNPELIENDINGFLFHPENTEELENCLVKYMKDDQLRIRHGRKGRNTALQYHSIDSMVKEFQSAWGSIRDN